MTVDELITLVRTDLDEADIDNERVKDPDILKGLNRAYIDASLISRCFRRTANITAIAEQQTYSWVSDAFDIESVRHQTTLLQPTTVGMLNAESRSWRDATSGTPRQWYKHDARKIGIYPKPSTGGGIFYASFYITPYAHGTVPTDGIAELELGGDSPVLPATHHKLLSYGAEVELCRGILAGEEQAKERAVEAKTLMQAMLDDLSRFVLRGG